MSAVSRFDTYRSKRARRQVVAWAQPALYGGGALLAVLLVFQLFFRYQYIDSNGVLLRVDRITQQTCRVGVGVPQCLDNVTAARRRFSTSTSTSTSLSTSVSLKPAIHKKH